MKEGEARVTDHRRLVSLITIHLMDKTSGRVMADTHKLLCEPKAAVGLEDPKLRAEVKKVKLVKLKSFRLMFNLF